MKITAREYASQTSRTEEFDTQEDFGYTDEGWKALSEEEKFKIVHEYVLDSPEQPYWALEKFEEEEN